MSLLNKHQSKIDKIAEFKVAYTKYTVLNGKHRPTNQEKIDLSSIREKLNTLNGEVSSYVSSAGVSTSVYYSPPQAIGGMAGEIDFFSNLFNLGQFSVTPQMVIDVLDKAIGNYNFLQKQFNKKLINPLYWVGEIIRIPFYLLRFAGFNSKNIEISWFGKTYKLLFSLFAFVATVLTILNLMGFNTNFPFGKTVDNTNEKKIEIEQPQP